MPFDNNPSGGGGGDRFELRVVFNRPLAFGDTACIVIDDAAEFCFTIEGTIASSQLCTIVIFCDMSHAQLRYMSGDLIHVITAQRRNF